MNNSTINAITAKGSTILPDYEKIKAGNYLETKKTVLMIWYFKTKLVNKKNNK